VSTHIAVMSGGDEPSPRQPQAHCDACGAFGTVGRATRYEAPPQVWRFCRACWPAERARLQAAWEAETERRPPQGCSFDSRVWEDAYELLDLLENAMARPAPPGNAAPTLADLRALAAEMQQLAPDMDGPPPPRIAAFLQRYGLPAT
jgi:hypothetical protein